MPRKRKITYQASFVSIVAAFSAGCDNEEAPPLDCANQPPTNLGTCHPSEPDGGKSNEIDAGSIDCANPPEAGKPCSGQRALCSYDCFGTPRITLRCAHGRIEKLPMLSCNPPEPYLPDPIDAAIPDDAATPVDASPFDSGS